MCAVLNSVTDDLDKLNLYINECYRLGIKVCPPDVNDSEKDFIVNESSELVFGSFYTCIQICIKIIQSFIDLVLL